LALYCSNPHPSSPKSDIETLNNNRAFTCRICPYRMLREGRCLKDGGGSLAQPDSDLESTPIFLIISNLISDMVQASLIILGTRSPSGGGVSSWVGV
jgi:hypothetical protein